MSCRSHIKMKVLAGLLLGDFINFMVHVKYSFFHKVCWFYVWLISSLSEKLGVYVKSRSHLLKVMKSMRQRCICLLNEQYWLLVLVLIYPLIELIFQFKWWLGIRIGRSRIVWLIGTLLFYAARLISFITNADFWFYGRWLFFSSSCYRD